MNHPPKLEDLDLIERKLKVKRNREQQNQECPWWEWYCVCIVTPVVFFGLVVFIILYVNTWPNYDSGVITRNEPLLSYIYLFTSDNQDFSAFCYPQDFILPTVGDSVSGYYFRYNQNCWKNPPGLRVNTSLWIGFSLFAFFIVFFTILTCWMCPYPDYYDYDD